MLLEHEDPFSCRDARRLMTLMSDDDPDLSLEERESFEQHPLICLSCAAEHEEGEQLTVMLRRYWSAKKAREAVVPDKAYRPMTVEESWEDIKRRCPSLAEACRRDERKQQLRKVVWRIGKMAAAACILIAIGVGLVLMQEGDSGQYRPGIAANGSGGPPVALAELVTPEGRKPLALDQPITTTDQPQEILLGGMHRVVMNRNTKATVAFEPRCTEGRYVGKIPYAIQLAQGELYVEVVPGNPFTVKTANARLDITGTKFDVVADGNETEVTLLKGSIRFSALNHPQEPVSVTVGHTSTVAGLLDVPSAPSPVDARVTTAWARDAALNNAIALADGQANADLSSLSMMSENFWRQADLPDVDTLDYETWRDTHKQPRSILASLTTKRMNRAINADWIEVLMISGDIWQFHFDPQLPADQHAEDSCA